MNWRDCVTFEEIREYVEENQDSVAIMWRSMLDYFGPGRPYSLADFAEAATFHADPEPDSLGQRE